MIYVYALVAAGPAEGTGMAGEPLRLVRCGDLLVVVGEIDAPPSPTPETLAAQDGVVRRLADRTEALLPVRFGERAPNEAELCDLLAPRARDLAGALERVRGCRQMTLRVFGDADPVEEGPEQGGPGTRYLEARRREIERSRSLPEIGALLDRLRPLVRAERIERREQGAFLGTVYHLVRRADVPAYKEASSGESRIAVSGPWPPYAFAPGLGDRP